METHQGGQGTARAVSQHSQAAMSPDSLHSRPVLLFVHGWAGDSRFWIPQVNHFEDQYEIDTPDLAGHGRAANQRGTCTIDGFATELADRIRGLDTESCILVGHSMGGAVALEAARKIPERVGRVVMVDAFVMDWGRLDEALIGGFLATFREDFSGAVRGLIEQTCTPETDPAVIEHAAKVMTTLSPAVGLPALESLLRWDPLPTFEALDMPLDCINSVLVNPEARSRYAPFVTEYPVAGAGHYLQFEDEKGFSQLLETIVAQ